MKAEVKMRSITCLSIYIMPKSAKHYSVSPTSSFYLLPTLGVISRDVQQISLLMHWCKSRVTQPSELTTKKSVQWLSSFCHSVRASKWTLLSISYVSEMAIYLLNKRFHKKDKHFKFSVPLNFVSHSPSHLDACKINIIILNFNNFCTLSCRC